MSDLENFGWISMPQRTAWRCGIFVGRNAGENMNVTVRPGPQVIRAVASQKTQPSHRYAMTMSRAAMLEAMHAIDMVYRAFISGFATRMVYMELGGMYVNLCHGVNGRISCGIVLPAQSNERRLKRKSVREVGTVEAKLKHVGKRTHSHIFHGTSTGIMSLLKSAGNIIGGTSTLDTVKRVLGLTSGRTRLDANAKWTAKPEKNGAMDLNSRLHLLEVI